MKREGNIENLPKWAREKIELLERRIAERDAKLAEQAGAEETLVVVNEGHLGEPSLLNAPDDARVRFYHPESDPNWARRRWIDVRLDRDGRLCLNGSHCFNIRSHSGNVITVAVER